MREKKVKPGDRCAILVNQAYTSCGGTEKNSPCCGARVVDSDERSYQLGYYDYMYTPSDIIKIGRDFPKTAIVVLEATDEFVSNFPLGEDAARIWKLVTDTAS